jgi:hypothetical protein
VGTVRRGTVPRTNPNRLGDAPFSTGLFQLAVALPREILPSGFFLHAVEFQIKVHS